MQNRGENGGSGKSPDEQVTAADDGGPPAAAQHRDQHRNIIASVMTVHIFRNDAAAAGHV